MSAIIGFVGAGPQPIRPGHLEREFRLLEHRGLDGQSVLLGNGSELSRSLVGPASSLFGALRTSPLQIEAATAMLACCRIGKEGCPSPGNTLVDAVSDQVFLALDGLVENGPELGQELRRSGCDLEPTSELDILLAALERWGLDCFSRFTGSFAFAILDLRHRRLVLARDPFGTRPLYFARQPGWGIHFASLISALREAAPAGKKANRDSIYRYLAYNCMDHDPETFFQGIEQVPPGNCLEVSIDKPAQSSLKRYRRIARAPVNLTFEGAAQCLREMVVRSLASQVANRGPVGAALSGGFDSSFVAAAFGRAEPGARLHLYTCLPVTKKGSFTRSEEAWADLAASGLGAPLTKIRVASEGLPASFASLVRLQEEPFSSPVVYAQLQLFRAAEQDGVRLMLSGQGGDTLFAVTNEQLLLAVLAQFRRGRWRSATALLRSVSQLPEGGVRRLAASAARMGSPKSLQACLKRLREQRNLDWLRKEWFEPCPAATGEQLVLPMLRVEDRNSTACSILNRMPLLTTELQDFVSSLPPEYLVSANQPMKSIECAAMRGMVPDAILVRRERSGFPVPVREWLDELAPWAEANMTEVECFPFLVRNRVRQIWERVRTNDKSVAAAFLIWRWIFLAGWLRHCAISLD
jgi:asparagine synthase (glutamine-hydrolysing)